MMADISAPALDKAKAKVIQLVPTAKVDTKVRLPLYTLHLARLRQSE